MYLRTRTSIRVVTAALIALPALVVPAAAMAGTPAPARTVMVLDCSGLGQATVALDLSRPNRGGARVVSGGGVRLVTPLPIVATDRSTGAAVRIGDTPRGAIACTPVGFTGLRFRDAVPVGTIPPAGVSPGDLLDGRILIAVTVRIHLRPSRATVSLPLFPYDSALRTYLAGRTSVGAIALFDRQNSTTYGYFPSRTFVTASIVKADILATLLHKGSLTTHQKALAKVTIEQSDNAAATELWNDAGGGPGVHAFNTLVPMPSTVMGSGGAWALTQTNPPDQVQLVRTIAYPTTLLSASDQAYELGLMRNVISSQDWGVSAGLPTGTSVALKNGWFLASGTWHVNSIGFVTGHGLNYAIAILTTNNASEAYGIASVEGLSRIIAPLLPRPSPSVTSATADTLDLARRTATGPAEHLSWSDGHWSDPQPLGGNLIGGPALVSTADGLDVFARGSASNVSWRAQRNGTWSPWTLVPGQASGWASSAPAAVANPDGTVRIFVRGSGGGLWTDVVDPAGTWSGWVGFGGKLDSAPSACESADGTVTVGMVGTDDHLWTGTLSNGSLSGWQVRTGLLVNGDPAVVCDATGVELFARGVDEALWTRPLTGSWAKLDGTLGSGPSVTVRGDSLEVLAQFTDGRSHRKTRDGSGTWSTWSLVP